MNSKKGIQLFVTFAYLLMIGVNTAAVMLPLNGKTTQEVSDMYKNLFAPAGVTFIIWSVIYLLLAGFVIFQWRNNGENSFFSDAIFRKRVSLLFILSAFLNSAWLFAWQYLYIGLSVIIMLGLLFTLIALNHFLLGKTFNKTDYVFIRLPFSIYFGWITIATIADITAFFVSKNLHFLQKNQIVWTILVLLIGVFIAGITIVKQHDFAYGTVIIWAYLGILIEHQSKSGWNKQYPAIIMAIFVCLIALVILCLTQVYHQFKIRNDLD